MPRRKRTREEIEEALRDNERVNATPAVAEEPAVKKRRQTRRRTNRSNLKKAFQAIQIADEDAITTTTVEARPTMAFAAIVPPLLWRNPNQVLFVLLQSQPTHWPNNVNVLRSYVDRGVQLFQPLRNSGSETEKQRELEHGVRS